MKEKINEYPIARPITAESRKKIDQFIEQNATRLGRAITAKWDESGTTLALSSDPVQWDLVFHPDKVESFATAPFWLKMLFTENIRATVDQTIRQMLTDSRLSDSTSGKE